MCVRERGDLCTLIYARMSVRVCVRVCVSVCVRARVRVCSLSDATYEAQSVATGCPAEYAPTRLNQLHPSDLNARTNGSLSTHGQQNEQPI